MSGYIADYITKLHQVCNLITVYRKKIEYEKFRSLKRIFYTTQNLFVKYSIQLNQKINNDASVNFQ